MNHFGRGLATALCLAILVGCEPATDDGTERSLLTTVDTVIKKTRKDCSFIPNLLAIAAIVGVPGAPVASDLADRICAEVDKIPSLESGRDAPRNIEVELPEGTVDGLQLPKPTS